MTKASLWIGLAFQLMNLFGQQFCSLPPQFSKRYPRRSLIFGQLTWRVAPCMELAEALSLIATSLPGYMQESKRFPKKLARTYSSVKFSP